MDMQTVLRCLAEARSMIADLRDGYPMSELCCDPLAWLEDAKTTLEAAGWTVDDD